ncbi:MAG: hypothetical protein ACUVTX_00240 [Bacteroidales bacterium]
MKSFFLKRLPEIVPLFFLVLFLIFPSGFSTTDAWYYAACIKYNTQIFHPFHLLYNVLGRVICWLPGQLDLDTLACLKIMNSVLAALSLYVLMLILRQVQKKKSTILLVTALAGASFSVIRYATENETYILPLSLGITASYFLLRYLIFRRRRDAFLAMLIVSLSVLSHLSYVFWWAGIITGIVMARDKKSLVSGLLVSLIIPVTYFIAVILSEGSLNYSSIREFTGGRIHNHLFSVSATVLLLSAISFIRSFIQVHGYILNMVQENSLCILPGLLSVIFFMNGIIKMREIKKETGNIIFVRVHVLILVLMFLFAVISYGNAEFMVMIPPLIFIVAGMVFGHSEKFLSCFLAGMLMWNITYGLIPLNRRSGESENYLYTRLQENDVIVIAYDDQLLTSFFFYKTGISGFKNILPSPAVMKITGREPEKLTVIIDSALVRSQRVYTDCISVLPFSRAVLLQGDVNKEFFSKYEMKEEKRWRGIYGTRVAYLITGRK